MPILEYNSKALEAIRREQILLHMTELMAKKIETWEPGTWAEIQNQFYRKAEEHFK